MHQSTAQPARHRSPTAKATKLAHLIFARPDLDAAETYLRDFGFVIVERTDTRLVARAADGSPYCYRVHKAATARFIGLGFLVSTRAELDALGTLAGASPVTGTGFPGGGEQVVLTDPSGFTVEAVCGQAVVPELPTREPMTMNLGGTHPRVNTTQRTALEAPHILRLGHVVLDFADYQGTVAWYTRHFGLIPSDVQLLPDGSPLVSFMRLDLGDTPADHHTVAMTQGLWPAYNHSAYEVIDTDAIGMGQRVLRAQGYTHSWGIGRHILGSQIFDYWDDPWGDTHEHYCDGDVFTAEVPTEYHPARLDGLYQWGPELPVAFVKPKLTRRTARLAWHHVRNTPDVTVRKIASMARLMAGTRTR
jgi:catechol 2,3-dioxygenase-like lactoylglutathione lyase family enzyme